MTMAQQLRCSFRSLTDQTQARCPCKLWPWLLSAGVDCQARRASRSTLRCYTRPRKNEQREPHLDKTAPAVSVNSRFTPQRAPCGKRLSSIVSAGGVFFSETSVPCTTRTRTDQILGTKPLVSCWQSECRRPVGYALEIGFRQPVGDVEPVISPCFCISSRACNRRCHATFVGLLSALRTPPNYRQCFRYRFDNPAWVVGHE